MRWTHIEEGATREKTWFAWWPVFISTERRWLEKVTVRQCYKMGTTGGSPQSFVHWVNEAFLTK